MFTCMTLTLSDALGATPASSIDESKFARCAMRDGLTPVLEKAIDADLILIRSPIYFGDVSGETRSFIERFFFPNMTYNKERIHTYPKRHKIEWVFTMNASGEFYKDFSDGLNSMTSYVIGESEYLMPCQTQQLEDYSKYAATMVDAEAVKKHRIEQFPKDC